MSTNKTVNYSILAVNVGIIGAVFIFFAIAAQVPASTIFALDTKKCSFGFNILASHAQIGVVMVGGIIIGLFSISSVLALLHRGLSAVIATTAGFAVMFVAVIVPKYSKHNNDAKKIKQASKDYGTKSRSNIKENINQISSSDSGKDSNVRYH